MTQPSKQFADRLNVALTRAGFAPKGKGRSLSVAEAFQVSANSAAKWLRGENYPDIKRIQEIAKTLDVSADWLINGAGQMEVREATPTFYSAPPHFIKIPLLPWDDAGQWEKAVKKKNLQWIWTSAVLGPNAYALIVPDERLLPQYLPGTTLIVDPGHSPKEKEMVIYLTATPKEVICRELKIEGKLRYFKHPHPATPHVLLGRQDKFCGTVRQIQFSYA